MGIRSESRPPFIGFPSSYIIEYFTSAKYDFPLVVSIIIL